MFPRHSIVLSNAFLAGQQAPVTHPRHQAKKHYWRRDNRIIMRITVILAVFLLASDVVEARFGVATPKAVVAENKPAVIKSDEHPKWLEICNTLAPFTSVMCSLAPLPTIFEVARKKSVGSMPILPYSSMAANGFVWSLYGWLVDSPAVKYANMMGALLGAYYFKEFKKYTPPGSNSLPGTVKQHMLVVTWIVFLNGFILSNFSRKTAAEIVGKEGILMFIVLFASPLAAVKEVIATKSAASIPLPFTIASTINCSLWSVTGLLFMKDFNIFFPSVMGLMCALAQLFLKGIYDDSTVEPVIQMV